MFEQTGNYFTTQKPGHGSYRFVVENRVQRDIVI